MNDHLTSIPGTKTLWNFLLENIQGLVDKTNGYTEFSSLAGYIEHCLKIEPKPEYIIRNCSYFRKIGDSIPTISILQDMTFDDLQLQVANSSTIVVVNTMYVRKKYGDKLKTRVEVIPIGVDHLFFKQIPDRHREILPNSVIYIGSSSVYPKGFDLVLKLINDMSDINFCLVMKDKFSIESISEKNRSRVRIFNKVDKETVRLLINSCICAICTSKEETQHIAGIECGMCNVPIVATSVGVYDDCKYSKEWGILSIEKDFANDIRYVITHPKEFSPRDFFIKHNYTMESCMNKWKSIVSLV